MSLRHLTHGLRRQVEALALQPDYVRYRNDPTGFVREVLGADSAVRRSDGSPYQFEVLEALRDHPQVAVRSGHGGGKTAVTAWAALQWVLTRPFSLVLMVAPTFGRQVQKILLAEVKKWARIGGLPIDTYASGAYVEGYGSEWGIIGVPATEPERIEGFHSEGGVLIIIDEAKAVDQAVHDALSGALTSHTDSRLLVTSTPGAPSGLFYDIHTRHRDRWSLHHIPATDSSHVSPDWVAARRDDWGESSPLYQARVLGEFPEEAEGTLLPLGLLDAAQERVVEPGPVRLGVDPARFGPDNTAVSVWRGNRLDNVETRRGLDVMQGASWVQSLANRYGAERVAVDEIGLGAGVVDRLHQLGCVGLAPVNVARSPQRKDLFQNLRAELAWRLRESLERGEIALPVDDVLIAELSALRYDYDAFGRIRLESKDEIRQRIGRSPDRADALMLGMAPPETRVRLLWGRRARAVASC